MGGCSRGIPRLSTGARWIPVIQSCKHPRLVSVQSDPACTIHRSTRGVYRTLSDERFATPLTYPAPCYAPL
eukprot:2241819-Pyramimonas_sp.AAC.1